MKKRDFFLLFLMVPFFLNAQVKITIGSGADMIIGVGADVNLGAASGTVGTITNSTNANLVVKSTASGDGSLICGGKPHATVERYITVEAWHFVTPVTTDITGRTFYMGSPNMSWLAFFTESDEKFNYVVDIDSTLPRGVGYTYWIRSDLKPQTVSFKGQLTGSDLTVTLKKASNGWNLIGNPFPTALDWESTSIDHSTNITGTAYVWSQAAKGYLYATPPTTAEGTLPHGIIPMGQAFFVQANSNNVSFTIPAAARVHNHADPFLKSSEAKKDDSVASTNTFIRLDVDGGYYGNTVFIGFPKNGTNNFDIGSDATKLFSSTTNIQFYAGEGGHKLCVNANPPLNEVDSATVPLYVVQATGKKYTLKFSQLYHLPDANIILEDLKTGKTQDIRENPIYSFTAVNSDDAKRFLLHFKESATGIKDHPGALKNIHIFAYGKNVFIQLPNKTDQQHGTVYIYDMMGRKILEKSISGTGLKEIPVNVSSCYVVVRVIKSGITSTQKVFIQ